MKAPRTLPPTLRSSDADYTRERYDSAQAALYLDVPRDVIYTAIKHRRIGHRRQTADHGGRVRFSQADLDAWRQAQRVEAAAPNARRTAAPRARGAELQDLMPQNRWFQ